MVKKKEESSNIPLILENTFFVTISQIISKIIGLVVVIILARKLGVYYFGKYSLAVTTAAFLAAIGDFGLSQVLIREVAKNNSQAKKLVANTISIRLIIAVCLLLILIMVLSLISLPASTKFFILLFSIPILPNAVSLSFNSLFNAYERLRITAIVSVALSLLSLISIIIVLYAGFGLLGVALISIFISLLSLILLFLLTKKYFFKPSLNFSFNSYRNLLKQSVPFAILAIQTLIYFRIDILMLAKMSTEKSIGLYNASYKFIDGLLIIPAMFTTVMFPVMSRVSEDRSGVKYLCQTSIRYLLIFILPVAIGTTLVARPLVLLIYNSNYSSSAYALSILIWTLVFIFINVPIVNMFYSLGNTKSVIPVVFGMILMNISLNLLLIPQFDFKGASIATVATECFGTIILLFLLHHFSLDLDYKYLLKMLTKPILAAVLMGIIVYQFLEFHVLITIFVGGVLYIGVLWFLQPFDELDKRIGHYALESFRNPIEIKREQSYMDWD